MINLAPPIGRLLVSAIFIMSGIHKLTAWSQTADSMAAEGIVAVPLMLTGAVILELGGGLLVLFGWWARLGAWALIAFLIPTTVIFHDFWTFQGSEQQMQMISFMKNLAIMGGLFMIAYFGAGAWSIDEAGRDSLPRETRELEPVGH